jgi:hypothetical protein
MPLPETSRADFRDSAYKIDAPNAHRKRKKAWPATNFA